MANIRKSKHRLGAADYQCLADFRYQIRRFLRFSEEAARQAGLEPQHHQLMLAVKGAPQDAEPSIGYLAERLQLRHHSAVELVDRLVRRGLFQRMRGKQDRREVHVKLTPKGEKLLKELTRYHWDELRMAAPALVRTLKEMMPVGRSNPGAAARNAGAQATLAPKK